uniref:protein-tyrosine-phosphatase n=1 Tax=Syphacia muris TaxID=451379 RepID=A0A0N5AAS0_9BILA
MTRKKSSDSTPVMLKKRRSFKNTTNKVYSLETVSKPQVESTAFKSVSGKVIAKLMNSMSEEEFSSKYVLVDCRYPYEYSGGHLRGAINIFDTAQVAEVFFPPCEELFREISLKIPIFYCEYSQKRGPTMANKLRQLDRQRNVENYPEVDYKEIYLLDRGYKKFFEVDNLVHLCEPQSYISMSATPHKEDLKHYHFHKSRSSDSFDSVTLEVQPLTDGRRIKHKFVGTC